MKCDRCGSREWNRYAGYGYDAFFCAHCCLLVIEGAPRYAAAKELEHQGIIDHYQDELLQRREHIIDRVLNTPEEDPYQILEAIREITYMIAEDPDRELMRSLAMLVNMLRGG